MPAHSKLGAARKRPAASKVTADSEVMKRPASCTVGGAPMKRPASASAQTRGAKKLATPIETIVLSLVSKLSIVERERVCNNLKQMQVLPVGGGCSGTNVAGIVTDILLSVLGDKCKKVDLFLCEKEPAFHLCKQGSSPLGARSFWASQCRQWEVGARGLGWGRVGEAGV